MCVSALLQVNLAALGASSSPAINTVYRGATERPGNRFRPKPKGANRKFNAWPPSPPTPLLRMPVTGGQESCNAQRVSSAHVDRSPGKTPKWLLNCGRTEELRAARTLRPGLLEENAKNSEAKATGKEPNPEPQKLDNDEMFRSVTSCGARKIVVKVLLHAPPGADRW